jgi:hypothetical protein
MRKYIALFIILVLLGTSGFVCAKYYSYVFAKKVDGEILRVERVNQNQTIISGSQAVPSTQLFSFGVSIRDEKGEIHTASSEDRQWSVAQAGQCVEARFFPYPPWDFDKAGTYFNARLVRLYDCPKKN